jgi:hypothetical protein
MSKIEEYGYVDFKTIEEGYSEYTLKNGTIIRARAILLKVIKEGSEFTLNERSFASSFSPPNLKAPEGTAGLSLEELVKVPLSIIESDLDIISAKEDWNKYELSTGERVDTRAVLVSTSLTDKYDESGDPVYQIQIQILHKIKRNKANPIQK